MANAANALTQLELGASFSAFAALTDAGDHQTYTSAAATWSGASGKEPVIRPNGLATGGEVTPAAAGTNNLVDVAALTAYSQGALKEVADAAGETIPRATPTDTHKISSVTMTDAGAIAIEPGEDGTAFSEVRGAAGGPPLIPVDSVEIAQVRLSSSTAAPITAAEIFQVVGQHQERFDFPVWEVDRIGQGQVATVAARARAHVRLAAAQAAIHAGTPATAKKIYAQYYTPIYSDLPKTLDFVPAEKTHSVSSTQYYNGSIASSSETLGQGSFTSLLEDGVLDQLIKNKNNTLTVKFFPDRNKAPYVLTQGVIGVARTFPVANQVQARVTVTSEYPSAEFSA